MSSSAAPLIDSLKTGFSLYKEQRYLEALSYFDAVLEQAPDFDEGLYFKSLTHAKLDELQAARMAIEKACAIKPSDLRFLTHKAQLQELLGHPLDALDTLAMALRHHPQQTMLHVRMGVVEKSLRHLENATAHLEEALKRDPTIKGAHKHLIEIYMETGNLKRVEELLDALIARGETGLAQYYKSLIAFLRGDWQGALENWEYRWGHSGVERTVWSFPAWNGEALQGKKLLLWGEQGVGDELMFASMIEPLLVKNIPLVIQCTSRLIPLFERSFGVEAFAKSDHAKLCARNDIGAQLPMGDLMHHFSPRKDFPVHQGYMKADPTLTREFKERYAALGEGPKIGISWHSLNSFTGGLRTLELAELLPIMKQPHAQFISVQYGDFRAPVESLARTQAVQLHWDDSVDALRDMDRFAAQVVALDLVITVANSTVHMAGALGVPVWILVPKTPSWRWQSSGEDNHWYPHARLFRQRENGVWSDIIASVAEALQGHIKQTK